MGLDEVLLDGRIFKPYRAVIGLWLAGDNSLDCMRSSQWSSDINARVVSLQVKAMGFLASVL